MRKIGKTLIHIGLVVAITFLAIEIVLQLVFMSLPQVLIQRMPQYPERYGIQFDTPHGAREYPANEAVDLLVNQYSGDLYQLTCLSPKDALPLEPYQVTYQRDNHGFRNPEPWDENVDIVVIGDSFTAAESIIQPYWENIAGAILAFGLPGSGTIEQSLLLDYFGLPRQPKIVVLAYFAGNDLTDNQAFLDLQESNLTFLEKANQNRNPLEYLVTFHIALFIRDTLSRTSTGDCIYPINAETTPPTQLAFFDQMLPVMAIDEKALFENPTFQVTLETIRYINNQVVEQGAQFVLMYIPQKAEVYWDKLTAETKQNIIAQLPDSPLGHIANGLPLEVKMLEFDKNRHVQRDALQQIAEDEGFYFLDLTLPLEQAIQDGIQPYFFADTHWNQAGHDIAHDYLVEFLNSSALDKNRDS